MNTAGTTRFQDATYHLVSAQQRALRSAHEYARYGQDAIDSGQLEIAEFFDTLAQQDRERAAACHRLLQQLNEPPVGPVGV